MTAEVEANPVDLGWGPATETERALAEALASGDRREYFSLLSAAPLYLPGYRPPDAEPTVMPELVTADLLGQTYVLVFTSEKALMARLGDHANTFRVTDWEQLRAGWPHPEWRLAVNPDLLLDGYVGIEAIDAARRGELDVATESELIERFAPPSTQPETTPPSADLPSVAEAALAVAVEAQDLRAYVAIMFTLDVLVPTVEVAGSADAPPGDGGGDGEGQREGEGEGWWLVGGRDDDPVLAVFTSAAIAAKAFGSPIPTVTAAFAAIVDACPAECTILVNPGSALGAELDPGELRLLSSPDGPR